MNARPQHDGEKTVGVSEPVVTGAGGLQGQIEDSIIHEFRLQRLD